MIHPRIAAFAALLTAAPAFAQGTVLSYTRSASATERIKTAYGGFAVWIDERKWTQTEQTVTDKAATLQFAKGDTAGLVVTQPTGVPTSLIPKRLLDLLRKAKDVTDATIVSKEQRSVNGKYVLSVQVILTTTGEPLRAYCYLYGGTSGTIVLIGMARESDFDHEAGDIADFLNGVEISDQDLAKTGSPTREERHQLKQEQQAEQRAAKAKRKNDEEARASQPTQSDIVEKCITLHNIVFTPSRGLFFASDATLSGTISNNCGREVEVSIDVKFYSDSGDAIDWEHLAKLVPTGDSSFWSSPGLNSDARVLSKAGKVTSVYANVL